MSDDARLRDAIVATGASLFNRGLTHGSTGNISLRHPDGGWLMTPTGSSLGTLNPARLSRLAEDGTLMSGEATNKEAILHAVMYGESIATGAVVHLHSTHSVAVSCLDGLDPASVLPPITAYSVMRVGALALAPYFPPGDERLAEAVATLAARHHAILLANHGPVVAGRDLAAATDAIEELEETARLYLLLRREKIRALSLAEVEEIRKKFPV